MTPRKSVRIRALWGYLSSHQGEYETVRSLAARLGYTCVNTAWFDLCHLRSLNYVDWEPGRYGTIRVLVPFLQRGPPDRI